MRAVVVCKLGMRDGFGPRCRVVSTEDPEIGLDFLIYSFWFAICLWVVGGGEG